jgi:hypothetical protein
MKEYAELKLSLLSMMPCLILVGTAIADFSTGENTALAFSIGSIGGFLYLLLQQRSIDGLPASSIPSNTSGESIAYLEDLRVNIKLGIEFRYNYKL